MYYQFHPTFTQLLGCVAIESAHIRTDEWYAKHVEFQHSCSKNEINAFMIK